MILWQFTAREIKSRPGRAILTIISIVIGVAAVVAVSVSTTTTRRAYAEMYQTLTGRAADEIVSELGGGFDASLVDELAKRPDVRAVVPILQRPANIYVNDAQGKRVPIKVMAMGIDPERDDEARDYKIAEGGFFDKNPEGMLLEAGFAKSLNIEVGDKVRIGTPTGLKFVEVIGLLAPEGAASLRQGTLFLSLPYSQQLFKARKRENDKIVRLVDTIQLVPANFEQSEALLEDVAQSLPPGLIARPPAARSQLSVATLESTQDGLRLASALSLIVAVFIILNTFLMNVSERRRQIAILRAIGATRGQILRLLVTEGFVLGLCGTVIGMGVGIAGAYGLTRLMERLYEAPLPGLEITPLPFLIGGALGIGISLLATYVPAVQASRVSPLEGMRAVPSKDTEKVSWEVTALGLVCIIDAVLLFFIYQRGWWAAEAPIAAAAFALVGFVLLIPVCLGPLSRAVSFILRPLLKVEGELAQRQLVRRRTRTTLTIGVLFVAISTGIGLGTTIVNNVNDVGHWFDRTIVGDFFLRATLPDMSTGLSPEVPERLGKEIEVIPGVAGMTSARVVSVQIVLPNPDSEIQNSQAAVLIARDVPKSGDLEIDLREGDPEQVRKDIFAGGVVIGTTLAKKIDKHVGDEIELARDGEIKRLRICAAANVYYVGGMALYMDRGVAQRELGIEGIDGYAIRVDKNLDKAQLAQVEVSLSAIADREGLMLQTHADLRSVADNMVSGITGGLWVLLALGFVVAGFGIVNTLTMNVLEQTRELGLLRVVAMTRSQVRKMVLAQAAIMGAIGLLPGAIVGALIAFLISSADEGHFGRAIEFILHPTMFFGAFAVAYIIVIVAAWIPAQRATRIKLTEALRYE